MTADARAAVLTDGLEEWMIFGGDDAIETARTAVVNMLVLGELVYLYNVRHFTANAISRDILRGNPVALWVCAILIGLQWLFTYTPPMQGLFQTTALDWTSWALILVLALAKFLAVEAEKCLLRRLGIERM